MGAIDTHTHVQFEQFDHDREKVLGDCWEAGLEGLVVVGTDVESSRSAIELCRMDARLHPTAGVHPHDASTFNLATEADLRMLANSHEILAIGEIGLDFYRNLSLREAQLEAFDSQLALATEVDLPVVIHTRQSIDEAYAILEKWAADRRTSPLGVMHCFSGTLEQARAFVDLGFLVSIPATITYPKKRRATADRTRASARVPRCGNRFAVPPAAAPARQAQRPNQCLRRDCGSGTSSRPTAR
jgi:TatD DNase family protein